ncbi:MAG: hypothetical protein EPN14_04080 [Gallionella sp.]|nr:MAG: hypothetical protein EPN14_04080 [Gallionella sp.]
MRNELTLSSFMKIQKRFMTLAILFGLFGAGLAYAQPATTGGEPPTAQPEPKVTWSRESPPDDDSYAARNINRRQVHSIDPNIWAYTAKFAERFKMPKEWIAPDLQGAEAVAFRMEPYYKSCGWGGNPNSCREDVVFCYIDLYFDNKKHPLPWKKGIRQTDFEQRRSSVWFIENFRVNPIQRPRRGSILLSPFADPATGEEIDWMSYGSISIGRAQIGVYDQEVFKDISLVSFPDSCQTIDKLWLPSSAAKTLTDLKNPELALVSVPMPESLHIRIKEIIQANATKNEAHFKKVFEGLKNQPQQSN